MQIVAKRVFFGGEEPSEPERQHLVELIRGTFNAALRHGSLAGAEADAIDDKLRRLLSGRGEWIELPGCRLASIELSERDQSELKLPLELLRSSAGSAPIVVRCEVSGTTTIPETPSPRPEGGRLLLATSNAGGSLPEDALVQATQSACEAGMHPFIPDRDHVRAVSRRLLHEALLGATVLQLICYIQHDGLVLHNDEGGGVLVAPEDFAAMLEPFASHLRLVVLTPTSCEPATSDPGQALVAVALALHRKGIAAIVAPRVPLPAPALPKVISTLLGSLLGDSSTPPTSLEVALAAVGHFLRPHHGLARLGLRLYARVADGDDTRPFVIRPYRGLLSFEREHARFYLGRENEIANVVNRIAELEHQHKPRFIMLEGASGVGKSSLAKAGIMPALLKSGAASTSEIIRPAECSLKSLHELVRNRPEDRLLLIVDQLEEVFTERRKFAEKYLQRLWALASDDKGTIVIATLRIDVLNIAGEVRIDLDGGRSLEMLAQSQHAIYVNHLQTEQLKRVIRGPARQVGLRCAGALVDQLCEEALNATGVLPMLEMILDRLWSERMNNQLNPYEGGLAAALTAHANACVNALPHIQRDHAKWILVRIATTPDADSGVVRPRSTLRALRPALPGQGTSFDAALEALVEGRLVVTGHANEGNTKGEVIIELAHEMLRRQWADLRIWIKEHGPKLRAIRDLERWVDEWSKWGTLLTIDRLGYIEQAKVDSEELNSAMNKLLSQSRRAVRQRRRLKFAIACLGALIVGVGWFTYSVWEKRGQALEKAEAAQGKLEQAREQTNRYEEELAKERISKQRLQEQKNRLSGQFMREKKKWREAVASWEKSVTGLTLLLQPELNDRKLSEQTIRLREHLSGELKSISSGVVSRWLIMNEYLADGRLAFESKNLEVARTELEQAILLGRELTDTYPNHAYITLDLSIALAALANLEAGEHNYDNALAVLQENLTLVEKRYTENPDNALAWRDLSETIQTIGAIAGDKGDLEMAHEYLGQHVDLARVRVQSISDSVEAYQSYHRALNDLARLETNLDRREDARRTYTESLEVARELASRPESGTQEHFAVLLVHVDLVKIAEAFGEYNVWRDHLSQIEELIRRLGERMNGDPQFEAAREFLIASRSKLEEEI